MTVFGLVRSAVGNDESARSKYLGPTGKRSAGKLACSVWSGGKAVRPYLSLFSAFLCSAPRRQLKRRALGGPCAVAFLIVQPISTPSRQAQLYAKHHRSCSSQRNASAPCPVACGTSSRNLSARPTGACS